jgi:hypothetical protein
VSAVEVIIVVIAALWLAFGVFWLLIIRQAQPLPPELGDDTLDMLRQPRADDEFMAALEAELAEMDKQIRGETGA